MTDNQTDDSTLETGDSQPDSSLNYDPQTGEKLTDGPERRPPRRQEPRHTDSSVDRETILRLLFFGCFSILSLFALIALYGFYTSVSQIIDLWFTEKYQPIFRAVFNLAVVIACTIGLSVLIRQSSAVLETDEDSQES